MLPGSAAHDLGQQSCLSSVPRPRVLPGALLQPCRCPGAGQPQTPAFDYVHFGYQQCFDPDQPCNAAQLMLFYRSLLNDLSRWFKVLNCYIRLVLTCLMIRKMLKALHGGVGTAWPRMTYAVSQYDSTLVSFRRSTQLNRTKACAHPCTSLLRCHPCVLPGFCCLHTAAGCRCLYCLHSVPPQWPETRCAGDNALLHLHHTAFDQRQL